MADKPSWEMSHDQWRVAYDNLQEERDNALQKAGELEDAWGEACRERDEARAESESRFDCHWEALGVQRCRGCVSCLHEEIEALERTPTKVPEGTLDADPWVRVRIAVPEGYRVVWMRRSSMGKGERECS